MVFTKSELISSLQHEVHILLHLATKIEPSVLEYRPTPKQRSTLELLQYLSFMGPVMVQNVKSGGFDMTAWGGQKEQAAARNFSETMDAIASQRNFYETAIGSMDDADFRVEIEMFGRKVTRGAFLINTVLCGYAAYRTQLFVYLKANGRVELTTSNLWGGRDAPQAV